VKAQRTRITVIVVLGVGFIVAVVLLGVISLSVGDDDAPSVSVTIEQREGSAGGSNGESHLRTVASDRSKGENVAVAATANLDTPKEIWLRVSAAPKQAVVGEWFVGCGADNFELHTFKVTPPSLQKLRIPRNDAPSCFVAGGHNCSAARGA
jgi:hypothetical protein